MRRLSLSAYNEYINISPPRLDDFDVRNFEENMQTVHLDVKPFRLGFYQVALLESGGGRVGSDGRDYDLRNCTLFFNLVNQIVYWKVDRDWRGYYCNLPREGYTMPLAGYPTLYDFPFFRHPLRGIHLERQEALQIMETFRRIDAVYRRPDRPHYRLLIHAETNVLLTHCLEAYDRYVDAEITRVAAQSVTERFCRLVRQNVSELALGLTTEQLRAGTAAKALFVTPGHLAECTRRDLDKTPTRVIQEALVREAAKLLALTDTPVGEIADLLGFTSQAYFSRVFTKIEQRSPTKYREAC